MNTVRYLIFWKPVIIWPIFSLKQKHILKLTAPKSTTTNPRPLSLPRGLLHGNLSNLMNCGDNVFFFPLNAKFSIVAAIWKCGSSWALHLFFFQVKEGFSFTSLARRETKRVATCFEKRCAWCLHLGRCRWFMQI